MRQETFADALGVSRTTASNIERGHQRIFLDQVYLAAAVLGVPVDSILPPPHLVIPTMAVRAPSDDPLPPAAARRLEEVLRKLDVKASGPSGSRSSS
jgi:transcriptional regulator with XRE-family HTH domain